MRSRSLTLSILATLAIVVSACGAPTLEPNDWTATPTTAETEGALNTSTQPIPTGTPTAVPAVAVAPQPRAILTPSPVTVAKTNGSGAYVYKSFSEADKIRAWPDGTQVQVVGDSWAAEGTTWRTVRDPDGNVGWMQDQYLAAPTATPAPATPTPAPKTFASDEVQAVANEAAAAAERANLLLYQDQSVQWMAKYAPIYFVSARVADDLSQAVFLVADEWYSAPMFVKERLIRQVGAEYARIASAHGYRGKAPVVGFLDREGVILAAASNGEYKILK